MEAAVIAFCGVLMFIARGRGRPFDAITIWSLSMAAAVAGLLLMVAPAPEFVTRDLSSALLLLATGNAWSAARRFSRRTLLPHWAVAGAVVWLIARRFPILDTHAAQSTVEWGIGSAYAFATAIALWPDGKERLAARPAMLVLLTVHGAVYAVRAAAAASGLDAAFNLAFSNWLLIEGQFRVIGVGFLIVAMTKQRADLVIARSLEVAQESVKARQRFLAQMSHEVRTPLNGVLGLAQVLARDSRLLADQRQNVLALESAGRHLLAIVNDALDLARIDAGRLSFVGRSFDLEEAADGCLVLVRPAATDKAIALGLEFHPMLPPLVVGDRTRLQQILLNLLWNALKFTPTGGSVTLRVAPAEAGLRFEVLDTGPGIPADRQHLLFQDFAQLEATPGEGSGLGLAISARLAGQMGGELGYYPGLGGVGSLFRLELPWPAASGAAEVVSGPVAMPDLAGLDLLVVDDVPVNRRLLRALLATEGHRITEAPGGDAALAALAERRFDAVLLDLHMPGMDGFAVTRTIRSRVGGAAVTIVAVSADVMPETVQACLAAGMDAVLAKPVDRAMLLTVLARSRSLRRAGIVPAIGGTITGVG